MRLERVRWLLFAISFFATPHFAPELAGIESLAEAADYESLMRDAVALRRSGDDAAALKLFQQAYELKRTPRGLAQMGWAEQALGRWSAADKHLRQALESDGDPWIRKNRPALDNSLGVLATHVGRLDVSGTPAGAEVRVDGEVVGQLPLPHPITVTAGGVALEVGARGYLTIVRTATVGAGTLTREIFDLQSAAPAASQGGAAGPDPTVRASTAPTDAVPVHGPASTGGPGGDTVAGANSRPTPGAGSDMANPSASAGSTRLPLVLVASGLAVASLAFGIVENLSWQKKVSSFGLATSGCGTTFPNEGAPGCQGLYDSGRHAMILAFVGYGLTAAFAATAVVLRLTDPSRGSEPQKVACAPIFVTAGVGCALRF